eukprot:5023628-Prymnesium_polylepis.1
MQTIFRAEIPFGRDAANRPRRFIAGYKLVHVVLELRSDTLSKWTFFNIKRHTFNINVKRPARDS